MLTTVFKDKIPRGISFPFPLGFLNEAIPGAGKQAVALYFVHGSHWNDKASRERLHMPRAVLSAGRTRPMFRNNNQKVASTEQHFDCHVVVWATPSESRQALQAAFRDTVVRPLGRWLLDHKPRTKGAQVWWYPETQQIALAFQ